MLAIKLNDTGNQTSKDLIAEYEKIISCLDCLSTVRVTNLKQLSNIFLKEFAQELWFHMQCDEQETGTSDTCDGFGCCGCPTMDVELRKAILRVECNCQNELKKEEYINSDKNMEIINTVNADNDRGYTDMINQLKWMQTVLTGRMLLTFGYLPTSLTGAYDLVKILYAIHDARLPYPSGIIHVAVCKTSNLLRLYSIVVTYDTPEMKQMLSDLNLGSKTNYFNVIIMQEEKFFNQYAGLTRISSGYVRTGAELEEFAKSNVSICFKLTSSVENDGTGDVFRVTAQQMNMTDITSAAVIHVAGAIGSTYSSAAGLHMLKIPDLSGHNCLVGTDLAFPVITPVNKELVFSLTLPLNKAIVGPVTDDDGNELELFDVNFDELLHPFRSVRYKMNVLKNTSIHIPYTTVDTCADKAMFYNTSEDYQLRTWKFDKYTQIIIQNIQTYQRITLGDLGCVRIINSETQEDIPNDRITVTLQCEQEMTTPDKPRMYVYSLYLLIEDTSFQRFSFIAGCGTLLTEHKDYTNSQFFFMDQSVTSPNDPCVSEENIFSTSHTIVNWITGGDPIVVFNEPDESMKTIEIPFYFDEYNHYKTGQWEFKIEPKKMKIQSIGGTDLIPVVPYDVYVKLPGQHHNSSEFPVLGIRLDTDGIRMLHIDINNDCIQATNKEASVIASFLPCSCNIDIKSRRLLPERVNLKIHFENFAYLRGTHIRSMNNGNSSFIIIPLKYMVSNFSALNGGDDASNVKYRIGTTTDVNIGIGGSMYKCNWATIVDDINGILCCTQSIDKDMIAYNNTYEECKFVPTSNQYLSICVNTNVERDFTLEIPEGLIFAEYDSNEGLVYMNRMCILRFNEKKGE